jgi:hypothetical protein
MCWLETSSGPVGQPRFMWPTACSRLPPRSWPNPRIAICPSRPPSSMRRLQRICFGPSRCAQDSFASQRHPLLQTCAPGILTAPRTRRDSPPWESLRCSYTRMTSRAAWASNGNHRTNFAPRSCFVFFPMLLREILPRCSCGVPDEQSLVSVHALSAGAGTRRCAVRQESRRSGFAADATRSCRIECVLWTHLGPCPPWSYELEAMIDVLGQGGRR